MVCPKPVISRVERFHSGRFCSHHIVCFLLLFSIGGTAVGTGHRFTDLTPAKDPEISELARAVQHLESAVRVDSVRHYRIQKVTAIMNQYNRNMPSLEKYDIANAIYQASMKYTNLDIDLICATITHESGRTWNPQVVSPPGAMGLMQVMPATGRYVAQYEMIEWTSAEEVLFNPVYNIRIGCRHLSAMMELFKDTEAALAAYNGGQHRASLWIREGKAGGILWDETQNYFPSVLKFAEEFRLMNH